jgi:hypothetical protein
VWKLLQWPPPGLIREKGADVTEGPVKTAVYNATTWLRRVIDPVWFPEKWEPLCVFHEFENRDVIHYRWSSGKRSFKVAQTGSIFVLEIRPMENNPAGDSLQEHLSRVRKVCEEVFTKMGGRWTGQGKYVPIPEFNRKVLDSSFAIERTKTLNKGTLLGKAISMQEAGVTNSGSDTSDVRLLNERLRKEDDQSNPNWFDSESAWMYWFRKVNWFADENRLVIYFLKAEAGPLRLSFGGSLDNIWFGKK